MDGLSLVTPTSDRPEAFHLCERWMKRAMEGYRGAVQWIVADDGVQPVRCTLGQVHVRRDRSGKRRQSFLGNLRTALTKARYDKILFIEDDDWYGSGYLSQMARWLDDAVIVGESQARYYHLPGRRYRICGNRDHASLCQTGIRSELIDWTIQHIDKHKSTFIDIHLWKTGAARKQQFLKPASELSVGIKGLPGTKGIGIGHRMGKGGILDDDGVVLRNWTSQSDANILCNLASC